MNKKLLILGTVGGLLILVMGSFWGWKYITGQNGTSSNPGFATNPSLPIFPSVGGGSSAPLNNSGGSAGEEVVEAPETPKVYQVSAKPVSGYTLTRSGGEWVARYVDRATGNIYESSLEHSWHKRITNTTLPKVQEAIFTSSSTVLLRFAREDDSIETLYGKVAASSTGEFRPLITSSLPKDITWLSARGNNIFYLQKDEAGGAAGFLLNQESKTSSRTFSYPLSEWIPKLVEGNKVFLHTKASAYLPGGLFLLSGNTTNPTPLLLGKYGLATLPNDKGTKVLISQMVIDVPQLSIFDVASKTSSPLPLNTFTEKCAWGAATSSVAYCMMPTSMERGVYPDEWYSSEKSFRDTLWKIDTLSGNVALTEKFDENNLDAIEVSVSPENRYFLFINKKDLSLWSVRLSN